MSEINPIRRLSRFDIMQEMKFLLTVVMPLLLLALPVQGITVPPLPFDASVLSEATTNILFEVNFGVMSRIEFTLEFDASPTNFVEVAIGTDANGDGTLGLDEDDWTFGFNCGKWFCREAAVEDLKEIGAPTEGRAERTFVLKRPKMDAAWNLVRVTRRGVAKSDEAVIVEGKRPGVVMEIR